MSAVYLQSLKTASDRSRRSLYLVTVASVLLFVTSYNIFDGGWPVRRLDRWYRLIQQAETHPGQTVLGFGDPKELGTLRSEYMKQFVSRALFTTSPLPGVSIDVNSLGMFGGVALVLLMILLWAALASEHEAVYLTLADATKDLSGAGATIEARSEANTAYNALAMTQMLSSPPTQARWKRSPIFGACRLIFLAPPAVYAWVVWTEWNTRHISAAYSVNPWPPLAFDLAALVVIAALSCFSYLHSRAMSCIWSETFFAINPSYVKAEQSPASAWMKIRRS